MRHARLDMLRERRDYSRCIAFANANATSRDTISKDIAATGVLTVNGAYLMLCRSFYSNEIPWKAGFKEF